MIEAHNISKTYAKHKALQDVSITVPAQSVYGLLGPNGAGKTTLIRIITQIIGPDSGEILLNGKPIKRSDIAHIGYMPEERGLYRKMKVGEQILYLAQLKGLSKADALKNIKWWFDVFGIMDWWNKKVEELSKGMQQKIQFIATVIHNPELLILDEPFTGFDPVNSEIIKTQILRMKAEGKTIILSTHRMESVEELCDNFSLINKSKKVVEGKVDDVRQSYKDHSYEIIISGVKETLPVAENPDFHLLEMQETKPGTHHLKFKVGDAVTTNEVVKKFLPYGELALFKEILPSINDIFIHLVKDHPNE
ncbi:MAG: ABC transporter ATP-binding protein [Bacteroidetes bacterium]|nr:ABC transporter ATP-binding protein [Bacteroidota bacterium]